MSPFPVPVNKDKHNTVITTCTVNEARNSSIGLHPLRRGISKHAYRQNMSWTNFWQLKHLALLPLTSTKSHANLFLQITRKMWTYRLRFPHNMEPVYSNTKLHPTQDVGEHTLQHNDKYNLTELLPDFLFLNVMRQVTKTAFIGWFLRRLHSNGYIHIPVGLPKACIKDEWVKVLQNGLWGRVWNATWDSIFELCCGPDKIVSQAVCDPQTGGYPTPS